MAIMETTVTNLPHHKGAFAESRCGGAIFYTPDITDPQPQWREVFDNTTAAKRVDVRRISIANYFVARTGIDGNHKVCMVDVNRRGALLRPLSGCRARGPAGYFLAWLRSLRAG